uniref:Mobilization protein n=1 Tax=Parastrongyloides trichosuri TaxID=131310 RepID=A0A0N4ZJ09_PARTI
MAEHAFTKKRSAKRYAVKAADQRLVAPALEAVSEAALMQFDVEAADRGVDPGVLASRRGRGAGVQNGGEGRVHPHLKRLAPHGAAQACRNVEAIQRYDAPLVRLDQEDARIIVRLGHGEDPPRVAGEQRFRSEDVGRAARAEARLVQRALRPWPCAPPPTSPASGCRSRPTGCPAPATASGTGGWWCRRR